MATQDELSANASPQKPGKPTGEPIDTYLMIGAIGAIAIAVIVPWLPLSNSQFETLGWIAGRGAIATFIITLFFAGFKKGSSSGGSFATIFFFAFLLHYLLQFLQVLYFVILFVASTIIGARSADQLTETLAALDVKLSDDVLRQCNEVHADILYPMG